MYLRRFQVVDLAKTVDSTKKMLIGEMTLKMQNELAHGLIPDLT